MAAGDRGKLFAPGHVVLLLQLRDSVCKVTDVSGELGNIVAYSGRVTDRVHVRRRPLRDVEAHSCVGLCRLDGWGGINLGRAADSDEAPDRGDTVEQDEEQVPARDRDRCLFRYPGDNCVLTA